MGSGEYRTASTVAEVLLCFDIDNSTPNYMIARAAAGMGNKNGVKKSKRSNKKGLILNRRIEEDSLFRHVFTNEELRKLFEKIILLLLILSVHHNLFPVNVFAN